MRPAFEMLRRREKSSGSGADEVDASGWCVACGAGDGRDDFGRDAVALMGDIAWVQRVLERNGEGYLRGISALILDHLVCERHLAISIPPA